MGILARLERRVLRQILTVSLACAPTPALLLGGYTEVEDLAQEPILTPSFAHRKTAKIRLDNGLEAYLISDPLAEKSAAALCVDIGSWDDPDEYPGMAHFVEHLLFLGTKRYPDEGAFDRFVQQHGGQGNASTAVDRTCYSFAIDTDAFREGLDRFSSFFTEPLFNPSGIERELMAIEQEFARLTRRDDALRYFVFQELGNPKHPNSRFTVGNVDTLSKVPRDALVKWYNNHYSSNLMHLVVYSSEDIESLKQWVDQDFAGIPNHAKAAKTVETPLFTHDFRGKMSMSESLKDTREVLFHWELPGKYAHMKDSKPGDVVSHILGHEGERSLLSWLKETKLAEGLVASASEVGNNNYTLSLKVTLTRKGLKRLDEVVEHTFAAIQKLRRRGVPHYIFDEMQRMARLNYQYQQRQSAYSLVSGLSHLIGNEDLATFPEQSLMFKRDDPDAIAGLLEELSPANCHIHVTAPSALLDATLDKHEPWTGTAYTQQELSREKLARWKELEGAEKFDVPPPNHLIPHHARVLTIHQGRLSKEPEPQILVDNAFGKLYYAQDEYYQVPELFAAFEILTPKIHNTDAKVAVMNDLYVKSLQESLNEIAYAATIAGLHLDVGLSEQGILLQIRGYSENAGLLLKEVLSHVKDLKPNASRFALYKETLGRKYRNFSKEAPYVQALETLSSILHQDYVPYREKARIVKKASHKAFLEYQQELFEKSYVQGVIYGNATKAEAEGMWKTLRHALGGEPYLKAEHRQRAVADFSSQESPSYIVQKSKTTGNAAILVAQGAPFTFESRAIQQILAQGLKAPFFETLRTKQQTGYAVRAWAEEIERKLFFLFAVESDSHDGRDLIARYELFLEDFLREMGDTELGNKEFEAIKESLITRLTTPPENLEQMGALLAELAMEYDGDFKWMDKRAEAMRQLTYPVFHEEARKILGQDNRKRLAVILRGADRADGLLRYQKAKNRKALRSTILYEQRSSNESSLAQKP